MRLERKTAVINHPWHQIAEGINQKYPNPHSKSARSNDVVRRWVDSENRLVTEKLVGNDFPVPSIIRSTFLKCTGIDFPKIAYSVERTELDPAAQSLRQYSKNMTMGSFLSFVEVMEYRPLDEARTELVQSWHVQCTINAWFDSWFEGQFVSTCKSNSSKGLKGLEWVTEKLNSGSEGLFDLEKFREGLKEIYHDCEKVVVDLPQKTGEISRAVEDLLEQSEAQIRDTTGEIVETTKVVIEEIEGELNSANETVKSRIRVLSESLSETTRE